MSFQVRNHQFFFFFFCFRWKTKKNHWLFAKKLEITCVWIMIHFHTLLIEISLTPVRQNGWLGQMSIKRMNIHSLLSPALLADDITVSSFQISSIKNPLQLSRGDLYILRNNQWFLLTRHQNQTPETYFWNCLIAPYVFTQNKPDCKVFQGYQGTFTEIWGSILFWDFCLFFFSFRWLNFLYLFFCAKLISDKSL